MRKWSKKEAIRHLMELKNPFEDSMKAGQKKSPFPNLSTEINQIAARNRGVKPR